MKRASKKASSRIASGSIRIISGQWRGRKLPVINADGLRPTTDRNKEMLFNWLMHDVRDSKVLDMFAGSGGLGFEALSRYATNCTFLEYDKIAVQCIQQNIATLGAQAQVLQGDALQLAASLTGSFDLIFVDPPFHQGLTQQAIDAIEKHQLLNADGLIYLEQEKQHPLPHLPDNLTIIKQKQTAQVSCLLLHRR
ncbi:16S rRNA (guanine(966)-N(2))-methyltransferase RsmD [Alteromonas sp. ASW11-130]|uniref:16S rRNA (guanine(966)-N(2))-methyltransferase RsmD n=1 Tax=Alteromonas sp. ASW11-130 TaxID=3015775 RepID=UPI002241B866|nr:16S rRNA (guanine(966)-N(2))-methyltransferase RsmD [Alteromonas sp. ASW11-130]MCW8091942.1 16S rRNA (guanine(966)-N(2))-methyltransferase RsmD [Alteromonas sp. ASW11-130]